MGCGPSDDISAQRNAKIQVFGDYFSSDTRAVLIACKYAGVDYDFKLINTLKQENLEVDFKRINPTGQIPMLVQGRNRVLAPGYTLFEWLLATSEQAERTFNQADD